MFAQRHRSDWLPANHQKRSAPPPPEIRVCDYCIFSLSLSLALSRSSRLLQTLNDRPLPPSITALPHNPVTMARGNQRDKAREANQKKLASQVRLPSPTPPLIGQRRPGRAPQAES